MNGRFLAVIDSYFSDWKRQGQETHAISGWNGPGPFKIANNYLEASGVNLLFGGADPVIRDLVPSDIEIIGNHFSKPLAWRKEKWMVKNLFELKNARRVLVRNNIMEHNWAGGQQGFAVVLTPRNSSGRTPWVVIEDVEFSNNIIRSSGSGFNVLGYDDTARSGQLARLLIRDNLLYDIHSGRWGGTGTFVQIGGQPRDITIDHNTVLHTGHVVLFYFGTIVNSSGQRVTAGPVNGFAFINNMTRHNGYGIFGSGQTMGTVSLQVYAPGYIVRRNVLASDKSVASRYPPDNFFPSLAVFDAGFTDIANRNYELVPSSPYVGKATDGTDIGVRFQ
jgi:hypothetical protein